MYYSKFDKDIKILCIQMPNVKCLTNILRFYQYQEANEISLPEAKVSTRGGGKINETYYD